MEDGTFSLTSVKDATPLPVTSQEEKELRRVYDQLCDYQRKKGLKRELSDLLAWQESSTTKMLQQSSSGINVDMERYESNNAETQARIDQLRREIAEIESNPNKVISVTDVFEMMKTLKQKITRKEVEEIIWECDEDLDGCLNWLEFKLMFTRNILDKSGLEPSRMYNLTQFLIYDHNENGRVSVDETMNMLYARFGRAKMELKLKELFGEDMHETGREGGEIVFSSFVKAVEKVQMQTFWGTTKGRLVARVGGRKKTSKAGGGSSAH